MNTTNILIDFLITGLQTSLWVIMLALAAFGINWIDLARFNGNEAIILFLILPLVYPLGMFIDNITDTLLKGWNQKIRNKSISDQNLSIFDVIIRSKDNAASSHFTSLRSRIRIARSSFANSILMAISLTVFISLQKKHLPVNFQSNLLWLLPCASLCISALALFNWKVATQNFFSDRKSVV